MMSSDEADGVIKESFVSLKNRYQNNLESMKGEFFLITFSYGIINVIK